MSAGETPKYTHECSVCVFLGHHDGEDWYVCPGEWDSGIRRRGSEQSAYRSTLRSVWARDKEGMDPAWGRLFEEWQRRKEATQDE